MSSLSRVDPLASYPASGKHECHPVLSYQILVFLVALDPAGEGEQLPSYRVYDFFYLKMSVNMPVVNKTSGSL